MNERGTNDHNRTSERPELAAGFQRMWLADLSIRQPVFITMLVLAVMVVGGIFYTRLGLDLFPDIDFPVAVVQTAYPGASPPEVERSVTRPIEDAVSSINGVDTVRSTSLDSVSIVVVEFKMNKDAREAADDIRTRVTTVRNSLPADVKEPVVERFDPSAAPILSLAVADTSGKRSPEVMRALAEDVLKVRLEHVAGVASVDVVGSLSREVHVDLKRDRLEAYGIAPQQVIQAIRSENVDVPAGRIPNGPHEASLRTAGQVQSLTQLGEVPIAVRPRVGAVKLKDVADVSDGNADVQARSRLDGRDSVVVEVRKQSGTNTVGVADAVKREVASLQQEDPNLAVAVAFDQSTFTREAVGDVQVSLLLGGVLAALVVLLFFRDVRNTLVTVAGLPVIMFGTFAVLYLLGLSLNMITLMALSLSVGMLIDDAIVVRENIIRHVERGEEPRIAASRGTAEIALAVVAVTSTIVAVFLPIAFADGIVGKFLRDFGITVAVAVAISLLEALTLAPMLSAYFFKHIDPSDRRSVGERSHHLDALNAGYRRLLSWSLRRRFVVVLVGLLALAASLAILRLMVFSFVPQTDQGEFGVSLALPAGTSLAETDRIARAAEGVIRADSAVEHVFTTVGSNEGAADRATLSVKLHQRGATEAAIARLRPALTIALKGATFTIDPRSSTNMFGNSAAIGAIRGQPIQFSVQGEDFAALDRVSADLVARLRRVPGIVDVDRSIKSGKPAQTIVLDRAKAADLGIVTAQAGATVRALINGERVGSYRDHGKDVDIVVRLAEADRRKPADVLELPVVTARGTVVPLSSVASLVQSTEPQQIERQDRQRQVVVAGGYLGRDLGAVQADARAVADAMPLPAGVTIKVAGQAQYTDESFQSLGLALGLAVLFVYMILASQFGSFVHPFTIMLALPFSIVGALLALFVAGFSLDILGMIGIILLMGLVTKNSILLVEFTNQLRRRGLSTEEAILTAGPIRLRPILMTTLAMIFGMIPVAAGLGAGSEIRRPMGVSVIGGLITSTLLTLVVVPVAYSLIDDLGRLVSGRSRLLPAEAAAAAEFGGAMRGRRVRSRRLLASMAVLALVVLTSAAALYWSASRPSETTSVPVAQRLSAAASPTPTPIVIAAAATRAPSPATSSTAQPTPAASPTSAGEPLAPAEAPTAPVAVGNTDGLGVYVRQSPTTGAKRIIAWPDGTQLARLGETAETSGRTWIQVRDPNGTVGWVPREYLVAAGP